MGPCTTVLAPLPIYPHPLPSSSTFPGSSVFRKGPLWLPAGNQWAWSGLWVSQVAKLLRPTPGTPSLCSSHPATIPAAPTSAERSQGQISLIPLRWKEVLYLGGTMAPSCLSFGGPGPPDNLRVPLEVVYSSKEKGQNKAHCGFHCCHLVADRGKTPAIPVSRSRWREDTPQGWGQRHKGVGYALLSPPLVFWPGTRAFTCLGSEQLQVPSDMYH